MNEEYHFTMGEIYKRHEESSAAAAVNGDSVRVSIASNLSCGSDSGSGSGGNLIE